MSEALFLPLLLLLPLLGAVLVAPLRAGAVPRVFTLGVMALMLLLAGLVFAGFDGATAPGRHAVDLAWMPALGVSLHFAVDGLNIYLLLLTTLLFPVVLACTWARAEAQQPLFLSLLLALQAGLLGTFLAQDLVVFFVCWEAVLIPMVLLILLYGGEQRRRAAVSFFLYTMAGSVAFLAAVIVLGVEHQQQTGQWSFDIAALAALKLSPGTQMFVFLAIVLACAVKSPIFPFHSWLPLAYGEASPAGTALMAGVMSKMGAYGLMRLALPLAPDAAVLLAPLMVGLAAFSIVYGAVLALRQTHFKRLVAYASLSHMGYIVLGVFSFQATALHGAMFQILSHGVAVAGLFLLLGLLEERRGAAWLQLDALATRAPRMAVVLMGFVLASLALPLTSGFTAEFLILLGAFTQGLAAWSAGAGSGLLVAALAASLGVVLGATYMLRLARVLVFGDAGPAAQRVPLADLNGRELAALAAPLALILWVGLWPASLMSKIEPTVTQLSAIGARALPERTLVAPRTAAVSGQLPEGKR
ncbi:MAG: NADH-quinone oxidoreductase subunit M [Rubrivivax sp.]|nr:NADH-quinone oxidoreductase subunit M [Rubrivivax sp.]